jgi:hypothetical protein
LKCPSNGQDKADQEAAVFIQDGTVEQLAEQIARCDSTRTNTIAAMRDGWVFVGPMSGSNGLQPFLSDSVVVMAEPQSVRVGPTAAADRTYLARQLEWLQQQWREANAA